MSRPRSHYEVLGVASDATQAEIRSAYRTLARQLHPDRRGGVTDAEMAAVNEAHRVLSDPGRRAMYDAAGVGPGAATQPPRTADATPPPTVVRRDTLLSPPGPARYPWRLVTIVAAVGSAAVLISSVTSTSNEPPKPDGIIGVGSCVAFESNGDAREIPCLGGPEDVVVEVFVALDGTCPVGTVAHRDRQGLGVACVAA